MKTVQGFVKLGLVVGVTAVLTACGGGAPSEADVQQALEQEIQLQIDRAAGSSSADVKNVLASLMPKIEKITLHGCESLGDDAYQCTVEAASSIKGRKITNTDSVRMTKSNSGDWTLSR